MSWGLGWWAVGEHLLWPDRGGMFPKSGSLTGGIQESDFPCFVWNSPSYYILLWASGLISLCKDARKSSRMQMSDVSEAPLTVIYALAQSDSSRLDCGSSYSLNEASAARVQPASPSLLGSRGFWHARGADRRWCSGWTSSTSRQALTSTWHHVSCLDKRRCPLPTLPRLWSSSQEVTGETTRAGAWTFQSCLVSLDIFWNSDSRHILAIVSCTVNPSRVRNCLHSCSEMKACCCLNNQQEHLLSLALPLIAGEGIPKCQSLLHQGSVHTWKAFRIDAGLR